MLRSAAFAAAAAAIAALGAAAAVVDGPLEQVRFEPGDTIRAIAERHLKDPDLWPQILELSGLESVAALRPGTILRVPAVQVAAADAALSASLAAIQTANAEGAQVFAPVEIGDAIALRDDALLHRKAGEWTPTTQKATRSAERAEVALALSRDARDRAAEAVLSDAHGDVEGRRPADPRWSGRILRDMLVEFEQVRTLSGSTAQVTFRDLSRLRLNSNSNAVIQTMRADPLTGAGKTKVNLVSGDFYALLGGLSARDQFEVAAPGVERAEVSGDFWIGHDGSASRVANYDAAALSFEAKGEVVELGRNEGAVIPVGAGAATRVDVLRAPRLAGPADGLRSAARTVALEWSGVEGAAGYWLEIATDVDFGRMRISEWGLPAPAHSVEGLDPGDYHWRVSALDQLGLPGERSLSRAFAVLRDDDPPFLAIREPAEGALLREATVMLRGEAEPTARLSVDGRYVPITESGTFETEIALAPGPVAVTLELVDEAGNVTRRVRTVAYRPDRAARISLAPDAPRDAEGRILSASDEVAIAGATDAEPGARLLARALDGATAVETEIAADGSFVFIVPAGDAPAGWTLALIAATGAVEAEASFETLRDAVPPAIAFDADPPAATSQPFLALSGSAGDAEALSVNGAPETLATGPAGGRFDLALPLAPGPNDVELVARDAVGNVGLRRFTVIRDSEPPVVGRARIARIGGADGPIEIRIEASDATGLRQAAPFGARIGGVERRGFLRFDPAAGAYVATLPPAPGALAIIDVAVEDYAGNRTERTFE
ncbi:MAG: FecR domain-containing protein [Rubrimonas sp.]|uniref:FecR domain-containing protein n=1 Tax=Rubrimonas sp. TaxID=2036015 RepID=UPI002FDE39DE